MAAADLAARDLVDGVRGVAARRLAAGGAQAGGEPRAAPRGGDAEAHAQAGLVVVFHGLSWLSRGEVGAGGGGRAGGKREGRIRGLGLWERKRHGKVWGARSRSVVTGEDDGRSGLQTARTENRQGPAAGLYSYCVRHGLTEVQYLRRYLRSNVFDSTSTVLTFYYCR